MCDPVTWSDLNALINLLHYVYRYSNIPLMESLFMFTLFSINTVTQCISFSLLHFFLHDQCVGK